MREHTSTNSGSVALTVVLLGVASAWWQGWRGGVIYLVGFMAGAVGTAVNAVRSRRTRH